MLGLRKKKSYIVNGFDFDEKHNYWGLWGGGGGGLGEEPKYSSFEGCERKINGNLKM